MKRVQYRFVSEKGKTQWKDVPPDGVVHKTRRAKKLGDKFTFELREKKKARRCHRA